MTDLQQMSMALKLATSRSLLLIDEFGKGTGATDGAALACAVFEHLLGDDSGQNEVPGQLQSRPKVLAATHFHEIFELNLLPPHPNLSFGHMQVLLDDTTSTADGQITYLYNFQPGRSTASFGTVCAAMNGVAPEIVRRAEELILNSARGADLVELCVGVEGNEMLELQRSEGVVRKLLAIDLNDINEDDAKVALDDLLTADEESDMS